MISLVKADFMECDHSAGFQMARSGSNEGAGVSLMRQYISADDDVELFPNRKLVKGANFELNVLKAARPSPLVGGSDRSGIAINPTTAPDGPTRSAASSATSPTPLPRSSTLIPSLSSTLRKGRSVIGRRIAG
jgi:hypothetical protein